MLEVKDLCTAYLEGYIQCKVAEYLLHDKVLSSELDIIKEMAVKCMERYISQQEISEADKEKKKEDGELVFSRNGHIFRVKASELDKVMS